jgi:DNA-binding CsgD family transcriptional regulator
MESPLAEAHALAVPTNEMQRLGPVLAAQAEAAWLHSSATKSFLTELIKAYEVGQKGTDVWIRSELAYWLWRHGSLSTMHGGHPNPYASQIAGAWEAAAAAWEKIGCPYEQASALADSEDERSLRTALGIFERLGAAPMAAVVRRKLRASGVRGIPRGAQERTRQNPCGMTNREMKVLELLVAGQRNAEIARRLFVSEKTVGHHVSAVLAKLGVRSRGEAAAAAMKLGLYDPKAAPPSTNK